MKGKTTMLSMIIATLIGCLAGLFVTSPNGKGRQYECVVSLGFVAFIVGFYVSLSLGGLEPTVTRTTTVELASTKTTDSVSASFVIGKATPQGAPYYEYYVRGADGGRMLNSLPASDNVHIYNQSAPSDRATLVARWDHKDETWWLDRFAYVQQMDSGYVYEFHVPAGSRQIAG